MSRDVRSTGDAAARAQYSLTMAAVNRLGKWRTALAGRILGTRAKGDPESDGFRDLFDKLLILRAEVSALVILLAEKGQLTHVEWLRQLQIEAEALSQLYEKQMPGFRTTGTGLTMDVEQATRTMREQGWPR